MRVLFFLDFDGVLHHFFPLPGIPEEENTHFYYLRWFEGALREVPEAQVVIASTWRNNFTLDQLRAHFAPDLRARIIGTTPNLGSHQDGRRHDEVVAYLRANQLDDVPWVGIDDMDFLYRPGDCLVQCPDKFGPVQKAQLIEAASNPAEFARNHPVRPASKARSG